VEVDASSRRVDLARSGIDEEDDFMMLVEPLLDRLGRLADRLAGPANRDDVVQEAVVRAWLKRDQFDERRGAFSSWLFAITADQARKMRRRAVRGGLARPSEAATGVEQHVDVEDALARLPARQRLAIDCHYFAGLSVAETAAVMNCPEGTVKSTLAAARESLRFLLR
jgi:RNA polymerase sigma-70 factor (ECF subfamily)